MAAVKRVPSIDEQREGSADYSSYKDMEPTPLQDQFADWIVEETGYKPNEAKTKAEAFAEGVRLATALRMPFQRSPQRVEARTAHSETRQAEAEEAREARAAKKAAKPAAPVAQEEPAPKPAGRRGRAAKAAPVKTTTAPATEAPAARRRGGRRAAAAKTEAAF